MVSEELIAALSNAHRRTPRDVWRKLIQQSSMLEGSPTPASIRGLTASLANRDVAWVICEGVLKHTANWSEIAAAMTTLDYVASNNAPLAEFIWTGPPNNRFPVRRVEQVLYDLISEAKRRILLVIFAAHSIPHLCSHLRQAVARGVQLTLIVESEEESEGQLTRGASAAFQQIPLTRTQIFCWPLEKRQRNEAGRPGKLHAKCAIVDDLALIGSANLTDDAFNRNMELGILVRDQGTVSALSEHFGELIASGVLVEVTRNVA